MLALALIATLQAPAPAVQRVMANPASVHCVRQGGRVEFVDTSKGQLGICVLPDGRRIEEWKFLRASGRTPDGGRRRLP